MDITSKSITELRSALDSKEISAKELADEYFSRIKSYDDEIESYITVTKEKAYSDAEKAQKAIDDGKA